MNYKKRLYTVVLGAALLFQELSKYGSDFCATHKSMTCRHEETASLKLVCLEPKLNLKYLILQCLSILVPWNILEQEKQLMLTMFKF